MAARSPATGSRRHRDGETREVQVNNFTRLGQIGSGSFATVYKGKHVKRGSLVAIKSVALHRLNSKLKNNLFTEINILRELHHPHIVALFDYKETTNNIHLVMEFCPMGDLSYFMRKRDQYSRHEEFRWIFQKYPNPKPGGLHEVLVRHFFQQLASALKFLRDKSLIHRDVKPQNLLIVPPKSYYSTPRPDPPYFPSNWTPIESVGVPSLPTLKLADFGFARSLPKTALAETLCGSPLYMAPEILRYEKYDAKADLWSVGTVTYEMLTGHAPFKASNHIELLRKIETSHDNIKFPTESNFSKDLQEIVRALLKRAAVERISFSDFFEHSTVIGPIPGLVEEDRAPEKKPDAQSSAVGRVEPPDNRHVRRISSGREANESDSQEKFHDALDYPTQSSQRRPPVTAAATAPAGQLPQTQTRTLKSRRQDSSSGQRPPKDPELESIQERAAQDIAFERDYVLIEKRAVEVNAFADEIAASPRVHKPSRRESNPQQLAMLRRNTTQNTPPSGGSPSTTPSRAAQLAPVKRPEHARQESLEKRSRSSSSTTSAISKAVAMASGRLFSFGISPPVSLPAGARGTPSPPIYGPFPSYPSTSGAIVIAEGRGGQPLDEDTKALQAIEEFAHRSDVVFGFAEVKYKQLIPLAPSAAEVAAAGEGLGLREAGIPGKYQPGTTQESDDDLTADATVTLCEEALVLYVKSLSLLAQATDVAGAWWARKDRASMESATSSSDPQHHQSSLKAKTVPMSGAAASRMNKVVQWVRDRFNEVLEKAEFVRMKLVAAQKRLPPDHQSHPDNHPSAATITPGTAGAANGSVSDDPYLTPGVSAEKLMYTRALEMGKSAAVNELVCEDLAGCEIAYVTAIRMLEAVLDEDDEALQRKLPLTGDRSGSTTPSVSGTPSQAATDPGSDAALVKAADREHIQRVVQGFRGRLVALRGKLHVLKEREAAVAASNSSKTKSPVQRSPVLPAAQLAAPGSPRSR